MKFNWEAYLQLLKGFIIFMGVILVPMGVTWLLVWSATLHWIAFTLVFVLGVPAMINLILSNMDKL